MLNRTAFRWMPKLKPVVKRNSRTKRARAVPEEAEEIEVLATPIKSLNDEKIYKTIRLRNGLTALLISDPTELGQDEMAACALSVNVGSFSDPRGIPGLAHFIEHMVFLGSEMYPAENQFDQYVTSAGGSYNAVTNHETTTFFFEIGLPYLFGALEMMSQFFISPLMHKEVMQRERQAIDSEFADGMQTEDRRVLHLLTCMFPKDHPYSKFSTGNLESLRGPLISDKKLYCDAKTFRAQHYSANRMTVAVQSSMDMPHLEAMVADIFGRIPSSASQPVDFSRFAYSADTLTPEFRSLYYVKPVSDVCEVQITWCVRSLLSEYQLKPLHYIGFLLQHEGKGSLLTYLKKRIWALNIEADNSDNDLGYSSINTFFFTRIRLTKDGLEHLDKVIEATFSYLQMLRRVGPNERLFNEMKTLADNRFYFIRSSRPFDFVQNLAKKMHIYAPEHFITGDQLYFKYNSTGIKEVLDSLRVNNVNIKVLSNKHSKPIQYDMKEKWYGIKYRREAIPQEWLQRWTNVAAYPEFQIPEKNIYITTNFDVIPLATPYVETAGRLGLDLEHSSLHDIWIKSANQQAVTKKFQKDTLIANVNNFRLYQPNLFRKNSHMEVWYKPQLRWPTCIAILYFYFILPLSLQTPKELCLLDLWNDVVQHGLKDDIYRASLGDLWQSMYIQNRGAMLYIGGYSQHLHLLVESTTSCMRTATEDLTPKMFEALREVRARTYYNDLIEPSALSEDVLMNVLQEPFISPRDKAAWINKVTHKDLKDFGRRVLKKMYMQVLIQGNIPWYQAINIAENVHRELKWEALPQKEQPEFKIHQLPLGERRVRVLSRNKLSTNSIVTNYYQGEVFTAKDRALLSRMETIMWDELFYTLRTKEQLGYTVLNEARSTLGILGFSISVHTHVDKYSVQNVDQRIEAFLVNYLRELQAMARSTCNPDDDILKFARPEESLDEEIDKNWEDIIHREYNFERHFKIWAADEAITMRDLIDWMKNHFASGNKSMFRKLSVQIVGYNESNDSTNNRGEPGPSQMTDYKLTYLKREPSEKPSEYITNIEKFTKSLPLLTVPKVQPA